MSLIPKKLFLTKGVGVHRDKLTSFEVALRQAGIEKCNLVYVSSILPPKCEIVTREEGLSILVSGQITYCVMARNGTCEPNRLISSSSFPATSSDPGHPEPQQTRTVRRTFFVIIRSFSAISRLPLTTKNCRNLPGIHVAMNTVIDNHIGCQRTASNTCNRFQAVLVVRSGLIFIDIKLLFYQLQYRFSTTYVTGCSPAYPDDILPTWLGVKLGVERNHTLHLAGEQPQVNGNTRYCLRRNIADYVLYFLKERYQSPSPFTVIGNDTVNLLQFSIRYLLHFGHLHLSFPALQHMI